jgi:hypothetical protein
MNQIQMKLDLKSVEDFWNTFISPIVCFISIIFNLLGINVFIKLKKTNRLYEYLYYKSIVNLTYLIINLLSFTFKCGSFCELENIYLTKLYQLYVYEYFSSSLYMLEILIEISISLNRYLKIKNNRFFKNVKVKMVIIAEFLFSILFYIPLISCYTIIKKEADFNYIYLIELNRNCIETNEFFNIYDLLTKCLLFISLIIIILTLCYSKQIANTENSVIILPTLNGKANFKLHSF